MTFETRAEREAHARRLRADGLLLREIAAEMGVAIQTVSTWLCDPGGERLKARKDDYRGVCDMCDGPTDGSAGPGKAPTRCQACLTWTRGAVVEALIAWGDDHGGIPPREADTLHSGGCLPTYHAVRRLFGSWNAGLLAAGYALHMDRRPETTVAMREAVLAGESVQSIADRYGCTANNVWQRLQHAGTPVSSLRAA